MNILKRLRKPYLSILLSSLMLFVSCDQGSLLETAEIQTQTLDEYFGKHIELVSKMIKLKKSINYDIIDKLTMLQKKSIKISDLKSNLKTENIEIPSEIIELQLKIIENTKILYNNPQYRSLNQEEFLDLVKKKIINEIKNGQFLFLQKKSNPCLNAFNSANEECLTDFAASAATVGVVGLFTTFGLGTLIGGGIALIRYGECNKNARNDYDNCNQNQ